MTAAGIALNFVMEADRDAMPLHNEQVWTTMPQRGRYRRSYNKRAREFARNRRQENKISPVKVSLISMIVSMGIIVAAVILYFRAGSAPRSASVDRYKPGPVFGPVQYDLPRTLESLDPESAKSIIEAALGNRDPAQVTSHFMLGSSAVDPQEAIALLDYFKKSEGAVDGLEPIGGKLASGRIVEEVVVTSSKEGRRSNRVAQLILHKGKWLIDLDSYARHANPGWNQILGRKCETATVRIFLTPDSYYNGDQYEEESWDCYALISPDVDEILFGYAARDSAQQKALDSILAKEEPVHKATIRIASSGSGERMQFEITEVIADDWFVGATPFDRSF